MLNENMVQKAMDALTHGVYVLGVHTEEKDNLMTAAWLCQVSSSPAMLAVAVSASHLTAELIEREKRFTVSVLGAGQKEEALACGCVSGRKTDKTEKVKTQYTEDGIPMVAEAAAQLECKLVDAYSVTNHKLFLAEVVSADCASEDVLLYHKREFFG
ncbi:MAG: flavin reductase family protein [Clostridiales bacterium]|nr:flavin reductase family protein [Clostridiales bacterium]